MTFVAVLALGYIAALSIQGPPSQVDASETLAVAAADEDLVTIFVVQRVF